MLPKVRFEKMSVEDNINDLVYYSKIGNSDNAPLNYFEFLIRLFPVLDGKFKRGITDMESYMILDKDVRPILNDLFNNSKDDYKYQTIWDVVNNDIMRELENRLETKWDIDEVVCRLGMFPVLSRDILGGTYDINYGSDRDSIIVTGIHELCHILYFKKWREMFPNCKEEEYDNPHIAWYLSEAMIDPLLNNDVFKKYTNEELLSYSVFYEIIIEGKSVVEILREYVNNYKIEEAIKKGYEFFKAHEKEIKGYGIR